MGSAAFIQDGPFITFFGTSGYAAPEILRGCSHQGQPQDVWQLGILLYILKFRENPFDTHRSILRDYDLRNVDLDICPICKDLLNGLLNKDVHDRIKVEDALNHPWLNN